MFAEIVCGLVVGVVVPGILMFATYGVMAVFKKHERERKDYIKREVERQLQLQKEKE